MLVFSSRILFVPSLSVLLTRSMSRHVSFKLEPTALSLKPLLKYTPRRGLSAFASLRQWTLAWSRRINVIIWNLFCYLVVFNNNNFLALRCRKIENVAFLAVLSMAHVYNYLSFYGSNCLPASDKKFKLNNKFVLLCCWLLGESCGASAGNLFRLAEDWEQSWCALLCRLCNKVS